MTGIHFGQRAPAKSREDIERHAERARILWGFSNPKIKVINLIEKVIPRVLETFAWDPLTDDDPELGGALATTYPDKNYILMSDSIYEGAYDGDPECNYTLAHELGHLVLHKNVPASFNSTKVQMQYDSIFNAEWQADTFADYFLSPTNDILATCVTIEDIENRYNIPRTVAERRHLNVFGRKVLKQEDQLKLEI